MSPRLSSLLATIEESATMAASSARSGHAHPISLAVGEPSEPPPEEVRAAAIEAIESGWTRYGPAAGIPKLRAAIADAESKDTGRSVHPEDVLVTAGGKFAIFAAFACCLDEGDHVLIPAPYYPSFPQQVALCRAKPVVVPPAADLLPDPDAVRARCTPRTRLLVLNSPANPTAEIIDRDRLAALAAFAVEHDLWILSDDVYRAMALDGPVPALSQVDPRVKDRSIVVGSFSKRFSMTGYRLGYAVAPRPAINAMTRFTMAALTHADMIAQHAALAALGLDGSWERERLDSYRRRRELTVSTLNALPGVKCRTPGSALFAFPDCSALIAAARLASDVDLASRLRDEAGLLTVPGSAFGAPGCLRISYGLAYPELEAALSRLSAWALAFDQSR